MILDESTGNSTRVLYRYVMLLAPAWAALLDMNVFLLCDRTLRVLHGKKHRAAS
jgi:hypothetical protein